MQCLFEATVACAAAVEVNTRVQALVEDLEGRCVGVVARSAGRERAFRARRGIVLAGGGFVANPELVALHAPQIARCQAKNGIESDDGFVMRMVQAAGAVIGAVMKAMGGKADAARVRELVLERAGVVT